MSSNQSHAGHGNRSLTTESWLVSAGRDRRAGSPLNVPLIPASNFVLGGARAYARDDGTPTWEALEEIVGGLEGGDAVAFASGMAAVAAVFDQVAWGSLVVLPDDCYQGVAGLANLGQAKGRWTVRRLAVADTESWRRACAEADLVWLESPSNPLLVVADLSLEMQLVLFAVLTVASAIGLRPTLRRLQTRTTETNLNARGQALVGKIVVLDQPILAGRGRVTLGDGSWIVTGPDMVAGAKVRVAAVNGTELRVEPAP